MGQLAVEPLGVDDRVRVSLAGVHPKLVLSRLATGEWALPIHGLPSTHILKRGDPRFPHMIENEAFCLAVCRHLGLAAAEAEILALEDPVLVVTRYDREVTADGEIRRTHPRADVRPAMSVNGKVSLHDITLSDVIAEATSWGLDRNRVAAHAMAARRAFLTADTHDGEMVATWKTLRPPRPLLLLVFHDNLLAPDDIARCLSALEASGPPTEHRLEILVHWKR